MAADRGFDVAGPADAPAILLVHGSVVTRVIWQPQIQALSDRFKLIAPDLPGHGALAATPFTFDRAVETLVRVIEAEARGRALVVGLSLGCYVAIELARQHPGRVAGLVLSGCSLNFRGALGTYLAVVSWLLRRGWLSQSPGDDMSRRVDFGRGAQVYDRRHGALLPDSIARDLVAVACLPHGSRILDVGAGTGRVCLALAAQGFRVVGVEPARPMLDVLVSKDPQQTVRFAVGEGAHLPFADSRFDAVILARVLYLLPDWREVLAEVLRVVMPGGKILHEWGNGTSEEPWVQIREEARRLFEAAGIQAPFHPGVRSEAEVDGFLAERGCTRLGVVRSPGESTLPLSTFLERIVNGECSYTWDVPDDVLERCIPQLEAWVTARFDLARTEPIPREIQWAIHQVGT